MFQEVTDYLSLLTAIFFFTYFVLGYNIEFIGSEISISSIASFFLLSFLQIWPLLSQFLTLRWEILIYELGLDEGHIKKFLESISDQEIKDEIISLQGAFELFKAGRLMDSLVMISNFFEDVIKKLYIQKIGKDDGFGTKVKELGLNVIDDDSGYSLTDFWGSIRSKYVHALLEKIRPSIREMEITLRLLKNFLEKLAEMMRNRQIG